MIGALTLQGKLIAGGVILAFIVGLIFLGNAKLNAIKAEAYQAGVTQCQADAKKALDAANSANAKTTKDLEASVAYWADRYEKLSARRQEREQVIVTQIEEKLVTEENCQITPDLLAIRNRLRNQ